MNAVSLAIFLASVALVETFDVTSANCSKASPTVVRPSIEPNFSSFAVSFIIGVLAEMLPMVEVFTSLSERIILPVAESYSALV